MDFEKMSKDEIVEILKQQPEMLKQVLATVPEEISIEILSGDKDLAIRAISIEPEWYLELNTELSGDKDVVTALCERAKSYDDKSDFESHFIRAINSMEQEEYDKMFADRDFVFTLMDLNGEFFENASEELRNDRELLLKALETEGECVSLNYASEELRNDREIAEKAIAIQTYNYFNIGDELKTDRELVLKVLKLDPHILEFSDEIDELLQEDEFLLEVVRQNPEIAKYLSYDQDLQSRAEELARLEAEAQTISEAEALRDELEGKQGQNKGEE